MRYIYFAAWEPYNIHGLRQIYQVGPVLIRSCEASHVMVGWDLDDPSYLPCLSDGWDVVGAMATSSAVEWVMTESHYGT